MIFGINNIFRIRGCGELWFVVTLFFLKMIMQFFKKENIGFFILLLFIPMAIIYKQYINGCYFENWGIAVGNIFVSFPFFYLGYYLSRNHKQTITEVSKKISFSNRKIKCIYVLFALALSVFIYIFSQRNGIVFMFAGGYGNSFALFLLYAVLGILFIYIVSSLISKSKFNVYASIINSGSIMILAIHTQVISKVNPCLLRIFDNDMMYELSTVIVSFLILVAFIPLIKIVQFVFPLALGKRGR